MSSLAAASARTSDDPRRDPDHERRQRPDAVCGSCGRLWTWGMETEEGEEETCKQVLFVSAAYKRGAPRQTRVCGGTVAEGDG